MSLPENMTVEDVRLIIEAAWKVVDKHHHGEDPSETIERLRSTLSDHDEMAPRDREATDRGSVRAVLDDIPDGWAKIRGCWVLLTGPAQCAAEAMGFRGDRYNSTAILDAIAPGEPDNREGSK